MKDWIFFIGFYNNNNGNFYRALLIKNKSVIIGQAKEYTTTIHSLKDWHAVKIHKVKE